MSESNKQADAQVILALQCLHHDKQVKESELAGIRKSYSDRLKSKTKTLNESIQETVPSDDLCAGRLRHIQNLYREREGIEEDKASEISAMKKKIAELDSTFADILRRKKNPDQMTIFDGDRKFDIKKGIVLSADQASIVKSAAQSFADNSEGEVDGMDGLLDRVEECGLFDISFPDDEIEEDEGDEEDEGLEMGDGTDDDGQDVEEEQERVEPESPVRITPAPEGDLAPPILDDYDEKAAVSANDMSIWDNGKS